MMVGIFAEFERATIIDRVIAGMERKASLGGWCGGHEPFGYRAQKGEGRLIVDEIEAPLVPVIFGLYAQQHLGSHAIANWLGESGLATRSGRPWSYKSVLTVLRNRTYLGQVHFRGTWRDGGHPPLVATALFNDVARILLERGEDASKRASNSSDYLLTGLVVCAHCGHHFNGTRAAGRNSTYRYYTCSSRQRYGTLTCSADRITAEALDHTIINSLLAVYQDSTLFTHALDEARERASKVSPDRANELAAVVGELSSVDTSIERYLRAFETGSMPEALCAERVRDLGTRSATLRARQVALEGECDQVSLHCATPEQLGALRDQVSAAVAKGSPAVVKTLLQALIHEVRVDSRKSMQPVFRVPITKDPFLTDAVRALSPSVGATGLEPVTSAV